MEGGIIPILFLVHEHAILKPKSALLRTAISNHSAPLYLIALLYLIVRSVPLPMPFTQLFINVFQLRM
jgi:hypothetical protein